MSEQYSREWAPTRVVRAKTLEKYALQAEGQRYFRTYWPGDCGQYVRYGVNDVIVADGYNVTVSVGLSSAAPMLAPTKAGEALAADPDAKMRKAWL